MDNILSIPEKSDMNVEDHSPKSPCFKYRFKKEDFEVESPPPKTFNFEPDVIPTDSNPETEHSIPSITFNY
jgi:hypothetical protein